MECGRFVGELCRVTLTENLEINEIADGTVQSPSWAQVVGVNRKCVRIDIYRKLNLWFEAARSETLGQTEPKTTGAAEQIDYSNGRTSWGLAPNSRPANIR